MNVKFLWIVIKARFWLIFFTLALTVVSAALITHFQPRQYISSASLVLNFTGANPFEQAGLPAQLSNSYMATQLDIIRSQNVALKVVEARGMAENPAIQEQFISETGGVGSIENWVATILRKYLLVEPSRDSRVVSVGYISTDPEVAAATANAFAEAYIATTLELSMEPAARSAEWFDDQVKVLRKRLEDAQSRLTSAQQEQGIVALDERLDTETARLNELAKNYVAAQSETYDVKSRQLGENHPEYVRAIKRESSLKYSLEAQKTRVLELKKQRDELAVLAREVGTEQDAYEGMLQSYYQTRMESQFNQSNIAILNRAVPPSEPSSPRVLLNMASAVFLGILLGFALAFLFEILDRRVRSEEDVNQILETPVLATI
jgi:uncharacterized protein involved in exopolysaccharide biosynthesis